MGWYMNKRRTKLSVDHFQNLIKLHTYYVSNVKTKLKYVVQNINNMNDDEFYHSVRTDIYQNIDDDIDDENEDEWDEDDEGDLVNIEENEKFGEKNINDLLQCENYFNLVSKEIAELLKFQELLVIIELSAVPAVIDHGEKEFDLESLLDQQFSKENN